MVTIGEIAFWISKLNNLLYVCIGSTCGFILGFNMAVSRYISRNTNIKQGMVDNHLYSRQMILEEIGREGQRNINNGTAVVVGAGGLGSSCCLYLTAAGIGKIIICDGDTLALSNLHRQVMHRLENVGINKAESAKLNLKKLNNTVEIEVIDEYVNKDLVEKLIPRCDVIIDASDNFETRNVLNIASVKFEKPLVAGSALKWEGQLAVYNYKNSCCYECVFPQNPVENSVDEIFKYESGACDHVGVIGTAPGVIGILQAQETIKILTRNMDDKVMRNKMVLYNGNRTEMWKTVELRDKNLNCSICSNKHNLHIPVIGMPKPQRLEVSESKCISGEKLMILLNDRSDVKVIDCRPRTHFLLGHLKGSVNWPLEEMIEAYRMLKCDRKNEVLLEFASRINLQGIDKKTVHQIFDLNSLCVVVLCRRGNASTFGLRIIEHIITDALSSISKKELYHLTEGLSKLNGVNFFVA